MGEEFQYLLRNLDRRLLGSRLQDAEAKFIGGGMDIGDQTPAEAGPHPLLETFEVRGRLVGREHHLAVLVEQRVEGFSVYDRAGWQVECAT